MNSSRSLPLPLSLAPFAPAAVLALDHAIRSAGGPGAPITFLVWACTTAPLVLVWIGLRRLAAAPGGVAEEEVRRALEAVAQADRAAARIAELVAGRGPPGRAPRRRVRSPLVVGLFVALLLAGGSTLALAMWIGPDEQPVHIHAGFAIVRDGERLRFQQDAFDFSSRGILRAHIHVPDDGTLHIEGPPGETLGAALDHAVGFTLPSDARVYALPNGSETWRQALVGRIYVPQDGERILVVVGPLDAAALDDAKRAVPAPFARTM